jgi:hypothetical protein
MFQLLLAVSQWADHYCNRIFYPHVKTIYLDGDASKKLLVPDLISVTTLKEDHDNDLVWSEVWAADTDYILQPHNALPTTPWGTPYTSIILSPKSGAPETFPRGVKNFELAAKFGYREHKEDSGNDLNDAGGVTATETSLAFDGGGGAFAIGQTILMGTEQMLVVAGTTTPITVVRGINGTTAAAQADNVDMYIIRWPANLERAVLLNTARIWTRAPAFEPFFVDADVDTDVRLLLQPLMSPGL